MMNVTKLLYQWVSSKIHYIWVLLHISSCTRIQLKSTQRTHWKYIFPIAEVLHSRNTQLKDSLKQQYQVSTLTFCRYSQWRARAICKQQHQSNKARINEWNQGAFPHEIGGKKLGFAWFGCFHFCIYLLICFTHSVCRCQRFAHLVQWDLILSGCCHFQISPMGNWLCRFDLDLFEYALKWKIKCHNTR